MTTIDPSQLAAVRGGALGELLGAAGPILQGVAGIIGACKSGGGGAAAAAPPQAGPAPGPSAAVDPSAGMMPHRHHGPGVSVSVQTS